MAAFMHTDARHGLRLVARADFINPANIRNVDMPTTDIGDHFGCRHIIANVDVTCLFSYRGQN